MENSKKKAFLLKIIIFILVVFITKYFADNFGEIMEKIIHLFK